MKIDSAAVMRLRADGHGNCNRWSTGMWKHKGTENLFNWSVPCF